MIYGRIVVFANVPAASAIRPNWVTKIFVIGDVLAFFMQAGCGGMMGNASTADLGQKVILGGLAFQLIFFGFFLIIALIFRSHMAKSNPIDSNSGSGRQRQNLLKLLLIAALLIIARCIYAWPNLAGIRRLPNEERSLRIRSGCRAHVFGAGYASFHTCW